MISLLLPIALLQAAQKNTLFCSKQTKESLVFCQDFEQSNLGLVTEKSFDKDWPSIRKLSNIFDIKHLGVKKKRVSIAPQNPNNLADNKMLQVFYPKGKFGPVKSGATWVVTFPKTYEQLNLEYKVMFAKGFVFDQQGLIGGKLPGLMGGESISSNATANGKNGWTARLMWGQQGRGLGYIYYPDMRDDSFNAQACPRTGLGSEDCLIYRNKYFTHSATHQCISEWPQGSDAFKFKAGRFYKIKQQIKMNTIGSNNQGNRDGLLKIWVDDKLMLNCNNIRYRDVNELKIEALLFNTFFGGNTAEISAHPRDETIYFDDILIRKF